MGDRAQVLIKDTGVYLYTHWESYKLQETVTKAIAKKWRWDDPVYLARIIFDEMLEGQHGNETGFGISTRQQSDINLLITVNCEEQTVRVGDKVEFSFRELKEISNGRM